MAIVSRARPEILAMTPYRSARRVAGRDGVLLNANENPYPAPGDRAGLNRYPDPQPDALLERLAELYGVSPDWLLVTRGSDEALELAVRVFCQPYRDLVVHCPPTFGMYRIAAQAQGAGLVDVPLQANAGFGLDREGVIEAIESGGVRVVFLCSPNNPTGNLMDEQAVLEVVREARDRALVVVDEAYIEFAGRPGLAARVDEFDNLAVLRTLSKAHGLAGARCGAMIARPAVVDLLRRILPPYPLPTPVVDVVIAALERRHEASVRERIDAILAERERLVERLGRCRFVRAAYPSDANFVLVCVADAGALLTAAAEAGFVLRDMRSVAGLAECVRITIGTDLEMQRLYDFFEDFDREDRH